MNIDEMPAGREMDELVAKKVMGHRLVPNLFEGDPTLMMKKDAEVFPEGLKPPSPLFGCEEIPYYSSIIADAWEVLEKIKAIDLKKHTGLDEADECFVVVWDRATKEWAAGFHTIDGYDPGWIASSRISANTAPLAICRAALKAVL